MIFLNLLFVNAAQGQWLPQGINYYDPNDEILHLPSVYVLPSTNQSGIPQLIYKPVFQGRGDNSFQLISTEELLPEQECTRVEVLNAIPQMRLDISVDELNALIGCRAVIRRGQVDLETGLLVHASWPGRDGVPHTGSSTSGFVNATGSNTLISQGLASDSRPTVFNPFISTNFSSSSRSPSLTLNSSNFGFLGYSALGAPYITLALRENVVKSYSYSTAGHTGNNLPRRGCGGELQAGFNQLNTGATFETIKNTLGCDASFQNTVTVSSEGEQSVYHWHYSVSANFTASFTTAGAPIVNRRSQDVSVTFLNDLAQLFTMRSSEIYVSQQECTAEGILEAAQRIQVGDVVDELFSLLDGGIRIESFVSDHDNTRTSSQWRTQISGDSAFISKNRLLSVSIEGDRVT